MDVKSKLLFKKKCAWDGIKGKQEKEVFDFSAEYKKFMDASKTEREAVLFIEGMSLKHGFKRINSTSKNETKLIISNKGVSTALCVVNDKSFKNGFNIVVAHIDAPRLDLKPITLYESEQMAYMKTHYYGGIKKYQWVTVPLALHGIVVKRDGKKVNVCIGEQEGDPVFTVNDLLVHLAQEQVSKPASKVIEGEQLNILVGSIPHKFKSGSESVKTGILEFLNKKYGINEEDLVSAELQVVPAGKARDIGFDRSFIGGYGQDDRVCAYTALKALFDAGKCKQNLLALFLDKEEVGSTGTGGADSNLLIRIASQVMEKYKDSNFSSVIKAVENSRLVSADVTAGIDPEWKSVIEPMNGAKMGYGTTITKCGGSRGKYDSNDASAEFTASIRNAFAKDGVRWQAAELGKVDVGGGGTVSRFFVYFGLEAIDCGPALLSMHSPFEVASKVDIYHTYKAYRAFFRHC